MSVCLNKAISIIASLNAERERDQIHKENGGTKSRLEKFHRSWVWIPEFVCAFNFFSLSHNKSKLTSGTAKQKLTFRSYRIPKLGAIYGPLMSTCSSVILVMTELWIRTSCKLVTDWKLSQWCSTLLWILLLYCHTICFECCSFQNYAVTTLFGQFILEKVKSYLANNNQPFKSKALTEYI